MRLLAIYIKEKDMYKDICFSFTRQYEVKYENHRLLIERNNDYEEFYGKEIQDISVIVGKNGVGKTTLLNLLGNPFAERCRSLAFKDGFINEHYFLLYEVEQDKYFIEQMGKCVFENISGMKKELQEPFAKAFFIRKEKKDTFVIDDSKTLAEIRDRIVYLPENDRDHWEPNVFWISENISGLWIPRIRNSISGLTDWYEAYLDLYSKKIIESAEISFVFPINVQRRTQWKKEKQWTQIDENMNSDTASVGMPVLSPEDFFLLQNKKDTDYRSCRIGIGYQEEVFDDFLSNHINMVVRLFLIELKYILDRAENELFWTETRTFVKDYSGKIIEWDEDKIRKLFQDLAQIVENSRQYFTDKGPSHVYSDESSNSYIRIINAYQELFVAIFRAKEYIAPGIDFFQVKASGIKKNNQIMEVFEKYDDLQELYRVHEVEWRNAEDRKYDEDLYIVKSPDMDCLYPNVLPQVSSGEEKMISVIGNIVGEIKKSVGYLYPRYISIDKTYLFIIDEIEKEMHLEWSRNFIFYLVQYLSEYKIKINVSEYKIKDLNVHIQLIMSTHSPFMLSDLHDKSIIELEKDEKTNLVLQHKLEEKVFAQNIQRILFNDFFIKHSFGAFAEQKIQMVIDILNDSKTEYIEGDQNTCLNVIQEIGEPIVKTKLLQMYEKKFGRRNTTIEEIYDCIQRVYGNTTQINIKELEKKLRETE